MVQVHSKQSQESTGGLSWHRAVMLAVTSLCNKVAVFQWPQPLSEWLSRQRQLYSVHSTTHTTQEEQGEWQVSIIHTLSNCLYCHIARWDLLKVHCLVF